MIKKLNFACTVVLASLLGLLGSTLSAQKKGESSSGKSYLAKAREFSRMTGRPIFVVAGSKT